MDNAENDLRKRILSEESFDPSKEEELKARLLSVFERKRKKILLYLTVWVVIGLGLMFWGAHVLGTSNQVKLMLAGLALILIGYESTVLIKLWYWTVHMRINTAEDLKKLQLLMAGGSLAAEEEMKSSVPSAQGRRPFLDRLSYKGWAWVASVVVVCAAVVGAEIFLDPLLSPGSQSRSDSHMTFFEDGSMRVTARSVWIHYGATPMETFDNQTENAPDEVTWRDGHGQVIPYERVHREDGYHYTLRLPTPVFKGERFELRSSATWKDIVERKGESCVFYNYKTWSRRTRVRETIALPPGAALESVSPKPRRQWRREGRTLLLFEGVRKRGEREELRITYRVPEGEGEKPPVREAPTVR